MKTRLNKRRKQKYLVHSLVTKSRDINVIVPLACLTSLIQTKACQPRGKKIKSSKQY